MGGSWCEGDECCRQDGLKKDDTLWLPLIEGKSRKENKISGCQPIATKPHIFNSNDCQFMYNEVSKLNDNIIKLSYSP